MREWAERRGEVRAATVATLHFVRERSAEWRQVMGMLSLLTSEDAGVGSGLARWQYQGTWFHPHLDGWVHDFRYPAQEGGPQLCLRMPASDAYRPAQALAPVGPRARERAGAHALELVISAPRGRAFALVVPVVNGPFLWRCVREALFPAPEEQVVLH